MSPYHNLPSSEKCPIIETSMLIGDVWIICIFKELHFGPKRFNQFLANIPDISTATLSNRLKLLIKEDFVIREVTPTTPIQISYTLTPKGQDTGDIIEALKDFGRKYIIK
jgi:DNA-binding HxlR family transcriptional regulator